MSEPITRADLDRWKARAECPNWTQPIIITPDILRLIALVEELAEEQSCHHPAWCGCGPGRPDDPTCPAIKARALLPKDGR